MSTLRSLTIPMQLWPWDRLGHWPQEEEDWDQAERCYRRAYDLEGGEYGYCPGTALLFLGRHEESLPLLLTKLNGYSRTR